MSHAEKNDDANKAHKSFWETLPGIITAIAALVTAFSGCIATVVLTWPRPNILFPSTPTSIITAPITVPPAEVISEAPTDPPVTASDIPLPRLRIVSSGQEILKGSYTVDLDTGTVGSTGVETDIWWEIENDIVRYLNPKNDALFSYMGVVNFDQVNVQDFLTADYNGSKLNGSDNVANQLTDGTVILVRTNGGNFCKLMIVQYGIASPGDLPEWPKSSLLIHWETYSME